jgi:hypothetical protein
MAKASAQASGQLLNEGGAVQAPEKPEAPQAEPVARKIQYTGEVRLVVEDFEKAQKEFVQLVKANKGYLSQSEIEGSSGARRSGHWRVRVPVDDFQPFMEAVVQLGVPQRNSTDSVDVTEQYYDLEARIKNKKAQEQRLRAYLDEKKLTSKLEDILVVEKELNRVRGEVEQLEGQFRLLANLTALTTINVYMQEIKDYVPPQTPTFAATIGSTFGSSLDLLASFGKTLVLIVVALAPWLPVIAVLVVPIWLLVRHSMRHRPGQLASVVPAEGTTPGTASP